MAGWLALDVVDLTVRASDGTPILDGVTFSAPRGSLVAVVGPTGAGKTTLLNALAGRVVVESGSARVGGRDILGADESVRRRVGYVPQDDLLHPQLDLRRTLEYAAALRLGDAVDAEERARQVTAVLIELGLENQANLSVSSLSGGQRKRANVAVELLAGPEVLMLDEPTSGLDPGRERSVLEMLRSLADRGRTVVTVTHSPQVLTACDAALFLAPGGTVAFFGPPAAAHKYFKHVDAADVFTALGGGSSEAWKARFRAHPDYARYVPAADSLGASAPAPPDDRTPTRRRGPARELGQLWTLTCRYIRLFRADRRHVVLLATAGPLLGLLLTAVLPGHALRHLTHGATAAAAAQLAGDRQKVALFIVVSITWLGMASAIREIVKEHNILRREEGAGLSMRAYVGSKVVALGALTAVQAVALTLFALMGQDLPSGGAALGSAVVEVLVASVLTAVAAVTLALLLSALVTSPDKALTILPVTLIAQLVFCGALVPLDAPGMQGIRGMTSAYWGVHAIQATIAGDTREWLMAVFALMWLSVVAMAVTLARVRLRMLPTRMGEVRARPAVWSSHRLRPVLSAPALVVVAALSAMAGGGAAYTVTTASGAFGIRPIFAGSPRDDQFMDGLSRRYANLAAGPRPDGSMPTVPDSLPSLPPGVVVPNLSGVVGFPANPPIPGGLLPTMPAGATIPSHSVAPSGVAAASGGPATTPTTKPPSTGWWTMMMWAAAQQNAQDGSRPPRSTTTSTTSTTTTPASTTTTSPTASTTTTRPPRGR